MHSKEMLELEASKTIALNYKRKQDWNEEIDGKTTTKNVSAQCSVENQLRHLLPLIQFLTLSFCALDISIFSIYREIDSLISREYSNEFAFWCEHSAHFDPMKRIHFITRLLCTICVRSQRDVKFLPMNWYC